MTWCDGRILNVLDPDWQEREVLAVTFPSPPVPAHGILYKEDCWSSSALEKGRGLFGSRQVTCLGAQLTDRGPAFLVKYNLGNLLGHGGSAGQVVIKRMYCATISFYKMNSTAQSGLRYATDAKLEDLMPISSSCHPGSHTAIPYCPNLTLLLQMERAASNSFNTVEQLPTADFIFADDLTAKMYFPETDFSANMGLDKLFSYITVEECFGSDVKEVQLDLILSSRLRRQAIGMVASNSRMKPKGALTKQEIDTYIWEVNEREQFLGRSRYE